MRCPRWSACLAVACLALAPTPGRAHGLKVECKLSSKRVLVYAFYTDGTDAGDAQVEILSADKVIASGKTDRVGLWGFDAPPPGKYRVVVDAGAGHKTSDDFTVPVPGATPDSGPRDAPSSPSPTRLTRGPDREEATAYPWWQIAIGVGVIALVAAGFTRWRRVAAPRE